MCGTARGVDTLGERWAINHNIPVHKFPADWGRFGRAAGMYRNAEMASYADGALILWDGESGHDRQDASARYMMNLVVKFRS